MKRSAKVTAAPPAVRKAVLYSMGKSKRVILTLPVATPEEIRRSLNLSPTAKKRVERAIVRAGLGRKTG